MDTCEPETRPFALFEAAHPPAFLGTPPPPEPARPTPLAPSRPEGVEFGPLPATVSPLARVEDGADRFQRGQLIHALLQHLPALPEADWHGAALRFLRQPGNRSSSGNPGLDRRRGDGDSAHPRRSFRCSVRRVAPRYR